VAIVLFADLNNMICLEQDGFSQKGVQIAKHDYVKDKCLGFLRIRN
jgi:hypothetical protein